MPIYEYRCQVCGAEIEAKQKMSDPALTHCDACGAEALQRIISRTSFVLKGGGWYATDYKSPSKEAKSDGAARLASSSTKSESKSESSAPAPAPAATSESKKSD